MSAATAIGTSIPVSYTHLDVYKRQVYGEFMYKAGPWPYERRVVCKVEKPENQMVYMYTFIVTNMDSSPEYLIKFYCKRGLMENFIKESKSG